MRNIKNLISSEWWRELKKEIETRIAQVEEEILIEADKASPSLDGLRKKSADRTAYTYLLELPASLTYWAEEIEEDQ